MENAMQKTITILALTASLAWPATSLLAQAEPDPKVQAEAEQKMRDAERQLRETQVKIRDLERQMREAERQMEQAARQMADTKTKSASEAMRHAERLQKRVVVYGGKPRLGVVLRQEADPKADAIGATIEALSPGGPAEEAGLKVGDIITKIDGKSLLSGEVEADEDESAPAARLIEAAGDLEDGQKVAVEYRRGTTTGTATITARRLGGPGVEVYRVNMPDLHELDALRNLNMDFDFDFSDHGSRSYLDMDLTALNPDLGEYFGSPEGLLVVRAPKGDVLKLKAGDVILKIDGRTPSSPSQAIRILRSYEGGDKVSVEILRQRAKLTVSAEIPKLPPRHRGAVPAPPAAPAAPAPVAPVAPAVAPAAPARPAPVPPGTGGSSV
jgi:C-terminal processing protease CtpA/Prc